MYAIRMLLIVCTIHLSSGFTLAKDGVVEQSPHQAFLNLLATQQHCRAPGYNTMAPYYPRCQNRLLSELAQLKQPSQMVLNASLNWYWSSKPRVMANEIMQKRLFNQLQSPILDAILMEKRYLQSAMEFAQIQYRVNPNARQHWGMFPTRNHHQSIEELFHLTYNLPAGSDAYAGGYIHQDRLYGSAARMQGKRTELNRLIGHILGFVGREPTTRRRQQATPIPNNATFWDTLHQVQLQAFSKKQGWAQVINPLENKLKQVADIYQQWLRHDLKVKHFSQPGPAKQFIEYIRYQNIHTQQHHYAAFSLTTKPNTTITFIDLGPAKPIDGLVTQLRQRILLKQTIQKQTTQLARLLLQPFTTTPTTATQIIISPTGSLNNLPFALLTPDEQTIVYSDSWSILIQQFWQHAQLPTPTQTTSGIVLAAPAYGGKTIPIVADLTIIGLERQASTTWPKLFTPLAYTQQEAQTISQLSPDKITLLTGQAANEFALFERNHPKFIHIASHGYFLSDQWQQRDNWPQTFRESTRGYLATQIPKVSPPLNSGLALAGANQLNSGKSVNAFETDGLLTATDAASLNLLGTELVVLSACNTGLSDTTHSSHYFSSVGDGVSNLRSAFRQAGAQNVVMSLWPVADKPTWWFMEGFYQAWFSGNTPKQALNIAKVKLRQRLRQQNIPDHPYYWAGFIIQTEF